MNEMIQKKSSMLCRYHSPESGAITTTSSLGQASCWRKRRDVFQLGVARFVQLVPGECAAQSVPRHLRLRKCRADNHTRKSAREREKKLKIRAENDDRPKVTGLDCAARKVIECDATGEPSGGQRHRGYGDSHGPESGERGQIRFRRWGHLLRRLGRRKSPRPWGLYGTQGPGSIFRIVALRFRGIRSLYLAKVILYRLTLLYF